VNIAEKIKHGEKGEKKRNVKKIKHKITIPIAIGTQGDFYVIKQYPQRFF